MASAGVEKVPPVGASFKIMNLFEKSRPPVSKPIGGIRISFTRELTMAPKAAPMITPTARSTALPLMANSLNSFNIWMLLVRQHDIHNIFRDDHPLLNCLSRNKLLNLWQRQNQLLCLFIGRVERDRDAIPHLAIDLPDASHFFFA